MKTITVFGLAGASHAMLVNPVGAETFEHVRKMAPAKIYDTSSVIANNDYPVLDTGFFSTMGLMDNLMRSMFAMPEDTVEVSVVPNPNPSPFAKFWGAPRAQRQMQQRPVGLIGSLFSDFDDLDLSPMTRYQRMGMGAIPFAARAPSSRQTVEENEYDQPIIDRLTGQVRNEHIKTKDVKSEDGSFVIHSETRTFTGGSEDADPDEPTFTRDGTGQLLLESNPWQWMVEKSQGEVDQVVADPKSSSVSDIEAKKASLRARLEKLRAEEAEISKMLRDNELEADDEDYDEEAEENLEEEMEALSESDQVLQEEIDELDEVEKEINEALGEEFDDDEDEDDEDYDEDDIDDEDDEDDSDWDDVDEDEDEEKFIADISDMTPGEQEAKEEFDQIVEDEYDQEDEKEPLDDPDSPSEGEDEEFGAEEAKKEEPKPSELDKDSHVRFEN